MYLIGGTVKALLTLAAAAVVGFAIPAGWMRLGAEVQALTSSGTVSFVAFGVVFIGIIASYFLIIWLTGIAAARRATEAGHPPRHNWNRSLSDERHRAPALNRLETIFVTTTILVGGAYMVWFMAFAGSSLPGGAP